MLHHYCYYCGVYISIHAYSEYLNKFNKTTGFCIGKQDNITLKIEQVAQRKRISMAQTQEKQVMVVGIDDSDYSTYALEWTLDHLVAPIPNPIFKLVLVYAKPSVSASVGFVGPGIYRYL